jgi:gliding motility-associated-like protein
MKKFYLPLVITCLLFIVHITAYATHIVGGEFALISKGRGSIYELSLNLYFDDIYGNRGAEDVRIIAAIYSKKNNVLITTVILNRIASQQVNYTNPACTYDRLQTRQIQYAAEITLASTQYNDEAGYYVVWERCCRNNSINNIVNPQSAGMAFYMEFPAVVQNNDRFLNSSPVFSIPKGDYACINEPFVFDFSATDEDGDKLTYKLVTPYNGHSTPTLPNPSVTNNRFSPAPYSAVVWQSGININNVIPGKSPLRVDAATGQLTFTANRKGLYVFSVLCEEFRNGKKIGEVRRDYQLLVIDCPRNAPPQVQLKEPGKTGFYREGQVIKVPYSDSRCYDFAIVDSNSREQLNLRLRPLNFAAHLATLTPTSGSLSGPSDTLRAKLCWDACAQSNNNEPLAFEIIASDNGCPVPKEDILLVRMLLEPKPNNAPLVVTTLLNNKAFIEAGNSITFNVTGTDMPDNEAITLEGQGRGFDMAKLGMSFQNGTGVGSLTSPFVWQPECGKVEAGTIYMVDFIVKDKRCPEQQKADTVTVELVFKSRETERPSVRTTLPDNMVKLFTNQDVRFDVIANDPDNDPITLRAVGRGFDLAAVGMQFSNKTGIGEIKESFYWKPTCENTMSDQGTYVIDFIVEDNSCAANRYDTTTVTLELSDFEVVFEGFEPPNVFTPNGDGKNDSFYIENLPADNCKEWFESIEVYNRWGKLVYKGDNREFSWTGIGFPTGVYFYLIYYHKSTYKGTVSLLR